MTIRAKLLALFPILHAIGTLLLAAKSVAVLDRGFASFGFASGAFFFLYFLPVICYRLHVLVSPVEEGVTTIATSGPPTYNAWWGTHQFQVLFISIPTLEAILRLVPGLYSFWLRLWGANIGHNVYWTPRVAVIDRALLDVGDGVVFGHEVALCSHVITAGPKNLRLYVKRIRVGSESFIGARSEFGPGVEVTAGTRIPYATHGSINQIFGEAK